MGTSLKTERPRLSATACDLFLYAASAAFAFFTATASPFLSHKLWGQLATTGYGVAAFATALLMITNSRLSHVQIVRARWLLASISFLSVAVAPLAVGSLLRGDHGSNLVQDEVLMTERAGADLSSGYSPYAHAVLPAGAEPRPFPYMPLIAVFGIPRAVIPTSPWSDARIYFLIFSLVITAIALMTWQVSSCHRLLTFQALLVLPTGALVLNAGGVDVAVLALMLLSVSLYTSKRRVTAVLSACGGMLMKLTAWPLALLLFALMWRERASASRSLARAGVAIQGTVAILIFWDGRGVFHDTIMFPLFRIPAEAPWEFDGTLSGAPLVKSAMGTSMLIVTGAVLSLLYMLRSRTSGVVIALRASACYLLILIVSTPAGRPGLLVYPASLWLWSYCIASGTPSPNRTEERDGG